MARYALAIFLALAALHTWPIASAPWRVSLNHNADAQLNAWIIAWIAHTLPRDPAHVFDGNIFAPEPATVAYSEPLMPQALLGAPVLYLGGSPVLAFNLVLIAGLALTAWSTWLVIWRWTGSATAALIAGALAAFNVHLLTRLPHLQAAHAWGLPLSIYFADRLIERVTTRDIVCLALVVTATAATSAYWLALAGLSVFIVVVVAAVQGRWRPALAIAGSSVLGLALALPVLVPYLRAGASGATRPIEVVAQFSATPAGYLTSTTHLHGVWSAGFFRDDVNVFFAGVLALALSAVAIVTSDRHQRRRQITLLLIAAAGIVLSFGPATGLYRWLYVMDGMSGVTPMSYRRRAESFWFFPRDWAIDAIKKEGATHVMVHLERFGAEAPDVLTALAGRQDLQLLGADPKGHRLYRVKR